MEGDQSTSQAVTHISHLLIRQLILQFDCEPVRFPLKVPADGVHANAYKSLERCQDHLEEQEGHDCWGLSRDGLGEIEGTEERWGVQEGRK